MYTVLYTAAAPQGSVLLALVWRQLLLEGNCILKLQTGLNAQQPCHCPQAVEPSLHVWLPWHGGKGRIHAMRAMCAVVGYMKGAYILQQQEVS